MTAFTPLVTIAIPTWNRADRLLPETLRSALEQRYANIEVLVSDNASTDHTGELVKSFRDSRIRYLRRHRNTGAEDNFGSLLAEARGDYLLYLNDDDTIDPDLLERALAACSAARPPVLIRAGTRVIDDRGRTIYEVPGADRSADLRDTLSRWSRSETAFYLCSTLFDTRVLRESGGLYSPRFLLGDVCAIVRVLAKGRGVEVGASLSSYRVHADDRTHAARIGSWCEDSRYLLALIERCLPGVRHERPPDDRAPGREMADDVLHRVRVFVAKMAYRRCDEIRSPIARLQGYRQAGAVLGDALDPWTYLARRYGSRVAHRFGL